MDDKVKIAIDAMGGEKSPTKIINGIEISLKRNNENAPRLSDLYVRE